MTTPPNAVRATPVDRTSSPQNQRILIVDDNVDIVRVVERILAKEGYDLLTAHDGEEALEKARTHSPDLLLLDVMMPKIDGLEVCRRLKAVDSTSGIMIILVTGRGSLEHLVQGFDAGADDYIPKPFHIPELLARTRSCLRIKTLTDDLAERNEQLILSQAQLVQKEKMATIGLLASGIAHEFNNIMAGVSGYAQLAKRDPNYRDMLADVALTQAERAFELTKSLSTYHRVVPTEGKCTVGEVVDGTACLVAKELQRSGIRLTTDVPETLGAAISPGQLQEVLLNLTINAIHAIGTSGGAIEIRAETYDAGQVLIKVVDSGKGIPPDELPKIFDPFFTTKGALGGGSQAGTGLGLTVCYNIVQANSGRIEVESTPGRGTTFLVQLPGCSTAEEPATERETTTNAHLGGQGRLRILLAGGDESAHQTLQAYLEHHELVWLTSIDEALTACRQEPFDFVVLDVELRKDPHGFEALDRFCALSAPPRVILASGSFPDVAYTERLRSAHGHLLKPYKLEDLARLLGLVERSAASELASLVAQ